MRRVAINNLTKSARVGTMIFVAETALSRLVGLLGTKRLDAGCGVLITPSSGVHTFGMSFPIDVIALDKNLEVIRLWEMLRPYRITKVSLQIASVLELAPGEIKKQRIEIGDRLEICSS